MSKTVQLSRNNMNVYETLDTALEDELHQEVDEDTLAAEREELEEEQRRLMGGGCRRDEDDSLLHVPSGGMDLQQPAATDRKLLDRVNTLERQMGQLYGMLKSNDTETGNRLGTLERNVITGAETTLKIYKNLKTQEEQLSHLNSKAEKALKDAQQAAAIAEHARQVAELAQREAQEASRRMAVIESRQTELAVAMSKIQSLTTSEGGVLPRIKSTAENSIFLTGIHQLREYFNMSRTKDPVEIVSKLLFSTDVYYNMDSIVIADAAAQNNRAEARAVIIHMTSFFHKKMALNRIRHLLFKHRLNEVSARDSFPTGAKEEVKWLNRLGASMKRDGVTAKYRVINRRGQPILQVATRGKPFQDCQEIPQYEEQVEEEVNPLQETTKKSAEYRRQVEENRAAREQRKREASIERKRGETEQKEREKDERKTLTPPWRRRSSSGDKSSWSRDSSWDKRSQVCDNGHTWQPGSYPRTAHQMSSKTSYIKGPQFNRRNGYYAGSRKGD